MGFFFRKSKKKQAAVQASSRASHKAPPIGHLNIKKEFVQRRHVALPRNESPLGHQGRPLSPAETLSSSQEEDGAHDLMSLDTMSLYTAKPAGRLHAPVPKTFSKFGGGGGLPTYSGRPRAVLHDLDESSIADMTTDLNYHAEVERAVERARSTLKNDKPKASKLPEYHGNGPIDLDADVDDDFSAFEGKETVNPLLNRSQGPVDVDSFILDDVCAATPSGADTAPMTSSEDVSSESSPGSEPLGWQGDVSPISLKHSPESRPDRPTKLKLSQLASSKKKMFDYPDQDPYQHVANITPESCYLDDEDEGSIDLNPPTQLLEEMTVDDWEMSQMSLKTKPKSTIGNLLDDSGEHEDGDVSASLLFDFDKVAEADGYIQRKQLSRQEQDLKSNMPKEASSHGFIPYLQANRIAADATSQASSIWSVSESEDEEERTPVSNIRSARAQNTMLSTKQKLLSPDQDSSMSVQSSTIFFLQDRSTDDPTVYLRPKKPDDQSFQGSSGSNESCDSIYKEDEPAVIEDEPSAKEDRGHVEASDETKEFETASTSVLPPKKSLMPKSAQHKHPWTHILNSSPQRDGRLARSRSFQKTRDRSPSPMQNETRKTAPLETTKPTPPVVKPKPPAPVFYQETRADDDRSGEEYTCLTVPSRLTVDRTVHAPKVRSEMPSDEKKPRPAKKQLMDNHGFHENELSVLARRHRYGSDKVMKHSLSDDEDDMQAYEMPRIHLQGGPMDGYFVAHDTDDLSDVSSTMHYRKTSPLKKQKPARKPSYEGVSRLLDYNRTSDNSFEDEFDPGHIPMVPHRGGSEDRSGESGGYLSRQRAKNHYKSQTYGGETFAQADQAEEPHFDPAWPPRPSDGNQDFAATHRRTPSGRTMWKLFGGQRHTAEEQATMAFRDSHFESREEVTGVLGLEDRQSRDEAMKSTRYSNQRETGASFAPVNKTGKRHPPQQSEGRMNPMAHELLQQERLKQKYLETHGSEVRPWQASQSSRSRGDPHLRVISAPSPRRPGQHSTSTDVPRSVVTAGESNHRPTSSGASLSGVSKLSSGSSTALAPCVLCNQSERTHIAMPCMHYSFCGDCVNELYRKGKSDSYQVKCPVCRISNVAFTKVNLN